MNEAVEIDQDFGVPGKSKYKFDSLKVGGALKTTDLKMYQRKFSVRKITEEDEKTGKMISKIAVIRTK